MHPNAPALLVVLAASASAAGLLHPGQMQVRRDLAARQTEMPTTVPTGGADVACLTVLQSLYTSLPTPPPELLSYESAHPPTDPCTYSVPQSLQGDFSSYEGQVLSWYGEHSADIYSALSQCPQFSSIANDNGPSVCTTAEGFAHSASGSGSGSGSGSETGAGNGSGTGAGTGSAASTSPTAATVSKNVGPRETGFMAAAIVAAGFIGAVAAL